MRPALVLLGCQALLGCSLLLDADSLSQGPGAASEGGGDAGLDSGACAPNGADSCDGLNADCQLTLSEPACPAGCDGAVLDGRSYMACSETASFNAAEVLCQAQGMHLVQIDDASENAIVVQLAQTIGSYVWIGASDLGQLGSYGWLDGSVFYAAGAPVVGTYQNFGAGQPVMGVGRDCLQLHDEVAGPWLNAPCNDERPFVCERGPR